MQSKFSPCTRVSALPWRRLHFSQRLGHRVHGWVSGSPFVKRGFLKAEAGARRPCPVSPGAHVRPVTPRGLRSPRDTSGLTSARGAAPAVSCVFSPRFAAAEGPRDALFFHKTRLRPRPWGRLLIRGTCTPATFSTCGRCDVQRNS